MNKFRIAAYDDQAQINLSPMLDVVFIMLIFFIVVASFVEESGLAVNLPQSSDIPRSEVIESIQVTVEANGAFIVNGRSVTSANVRAYVQALYSGNSEASFAVLLAPGSIVRNAAVAIEAGRSIGLEVVPIVALD